jgi:hypothetical protein
VKLPSLLAVVVLLPACGGGRDEVGVCSSCVQEGPNGFEVCACVALWAPESSCPTNCMCDALCVDNSAGATCHGQSVCAGDDGSCPDGCTGELLS